MGIRLMLKNISKLEHKIEDRVYQFVCECDAPLGEVHDALVKMKAYVVSRIQEIQKAEEPKEEPK